MMTPTLTMVMTNAYPRKCGGCTLCCKLLPLKPHEPAYATIATMIDQGVATAESFRGMVNEWPKPAGEPCQHQRHGKGCGIYARRPFACRFWACRWLTGEDTTDQRRPDRSRVVIDLVPDFVKIARSADGELTNIQVVQIWCDPQTPDAWRAPDVLAYIERRAREGIAALIRFDAKVAITVFAPPMTNDGQWHEAAGTCREEHRGSTLWRGLAATQRVKVG